VIACRIHQVAYVENLKPRRQSNFSTPGPRRQDFDASHASATAGSHPPTTQRRGGLSCRQRFAVAAASRLRRRCRRLPQRAGDDVDVITADAREAERIQRELLAPLLKRDPDVMRDQLCIGPPEKCAELHSSHARAGCERVHLWPLADESQQIELTATAVLPAVEG
jgi:hypothetical protein